MARIMKEEEYLAKRKEILATAQRLVFSKGYERMTVQDILAELHISSGAFYHYFPSKPAVLEALIESLQEQGEHVLVAIAHDSGLSALDKLQRYFSTIDQFRMNHKDVVIALLRAWYADGNAIVRQKVEQMLIKRRAPLLDEIIQQGIREGVFTLPDGQHAGEIILFILQGMGNTHAALLLAIDRASDEDQVAENILAVYTAYMNAIERVLGAPEKSVANLGVEIARVWVNILRSVSPDGARNK